MHDLSKNRSTNSDSSEIVDNFMHEINRFNLSFVLFFIVLLTGYLHTPVDNLHLVLV